MDVHGVHGVHGPIPNVSLETTAIPSVPSRLLVVCGIGSTFLLLPIWDRFGSEKSHLPRDRAIMWETVQCHKPTMGMVNIAFIYRYNLGMVYDVGFTVTVYLVRLQFPVMK